MSNRLEEAVGLLRSFNYFRPAFLAKEYDAGSPTVRELFELTAAFLAALDAAPAPDDGVRELVSDKAALADALTERLTVVTMFPGSENEYIVIGEPKRGQPLDMDEVADVLIDWLRTYAALARYKQAPR